MGQAVVFDSHWANSRYEMKYIVGEGKARAIRDYLRLYLMPDEYAHEGSPPGYFVHSLYLDAPHRALYQQTVDGEKNRFKLRIRFYDEQPESPVFLEIKRRSNDAILKTRAAVSRAAAEEFLRGNLLRYDALLKRDARSEMALTEFSDLRDRLRAEGSVFVSYRREAYVHPTAAGLRVTFDRELVGAPYQARGLSLPRNSHAAEVEGVILELKYMGQFPSWMRRLVEMFNLRRQSVPKYVECFDALSASCRSNGLRIAI